MKTISSTGPTREQTLCKLVVLLVDHNLPAPKSIGLDASGPVLTFETLAEVNLWARVFGETVNDFTSASTGVTQYTTGADWQGVRLLFAAYVRQPQPEPVTEDMTRVREVAEHGEDEPRCPDPECGEPLADIASGAVGHCGRSCVPAGAVSE